MARQRTGWFHELREKGDAWWGSHPDQGERVAGILLTLVCGSLIFSTALVQIFIVVLTGFTVYTMVSRHTSVVRSPERKSFGPPGMKRERTSTGQRNPPKV